MPRVRRPKDKEHVFETLVRGEGGYNFKQLSHVFILSACLGYWKNKRVPFTNSSEPISLEIFSEREKEAMKMIALKETQDPMILVDDEEHLSQAMRIVEEYANGGLEVLDEEIIRKEKQGGDRISLLTDLIMQPSNVGQPAGDIISQMIG